MVYPKAEWFVRSTPEVDNSGAPAEMSKKDQDLWSYGVLARVVDHDILVFVVSQQVANEK